MRNLFFVLFLFISAPLTAQIKQISLIASGLTCSMCSKAIYKSLMKVHGIQAVDVDIDKSVFNIKLNDTATLSPDAVKKAVTDAGFSVSSFTMTVDLPATTIENDAHIVIGNATYHFLNVPKQNIAGKVALRLLDKQFTTAAEHKKYKKYTTMACYETGVTGKCCPNSSSSASRVYHVTL